MDQRRPANNGAPHFLPHDGARPARGSSGGELGVASLFTDKAFRPARVCGEIWLGEGYKRRLVGRAAKFATSVRTLTDNLSHRSFVDLCGPDLRTRIVAIPSRLL